MSKYINADELIPLIKMGETNECTELGEGRNGGIAFAIERIKQMPTADVRDNVHGEWIRTLDPYRDIQCSFCGRPSDCKYNYCPNCGADMEGVYE